MNIVFLIILFFILFYFLFFITKKKNNNTNCSTSCLGKNCSENNDCGESCLSKICSYNQTCFQDNCCTPKCEKNTCGSDGCGNFCNCDDNYTCQQDDKGNRFCCEKPDCSTGICGDFACGSCKCNDRYCNGSCCSNGNCEYKDICNSPIGKILGKSWARFCDSCQQCDLENPIFEGDSIIPVSGIINCQSCKNLNVKPVQILKDVSYYSFNNDLKNPLITYNYVANYCNNQNGNCDQKSCVCITDDDCKVYGCTKCKGDFCV